MLGKDAGKLEISVTGLLLLGAATLAATAFAFLLGIYVGKGVTEERMASEQRIVRLPAPETRETTSSDEVEVTFWDRLGKEGGAEPPSGEPAPPPTPTEAAVKIAPPATAPTATAVPVRPTVAPTPAPARPTPTVSVPLAGRYQVQVNALADRAGAERIARDLAQKGYNTRISPAKIGGQTLYRVRVGSFPTEEEAREAMGRLRQEGFPGAFLAAGGD